MIRGVAGIVAFENERLALPMIHRSVEPGIWRVSDGLEVRYGKSEYLSRSQPIEHFRSHPGFSTPDY